MNMANVESKICMPMVILSMKFHFGRQFEDDRHIKNIGIKNF